MSYWPWTFHTKRMAIINEMFVRFEMIWSRNRIFDLRSIQIRELVNVNVSWECSNKVQNDDVHHLELENEIQNQTHKIARTHWQWSWLHILHVLQSSSSINFTYLFVQIRKSLIFFLFWRAYEMNSQRLFEQNEKKTEAKFARITH